MESNIISIQTKRFDQMKSQNFNINNPLKCYLINKDMVSILSANQNILAKSDNKKINNLKIALLLSEKLKINDIYYPCNFFIIEKDIFEKEIKIIDRENNLFNEFKIYDVLIGKNGIFILNNESQKDKFIVYYLHDINSNDCNFDKIFLFKKKSEFEKEIEQIKQQGRENYFNSRNIINDKTGYYNLIDDGKIIGKYINLKRSKKFKIKLNNDNEENNEESNKNNNNNNNNNNEDNNNKNIRYFGDDNIQRTIKNDEKKKELIAIFFPHLLYCLSKITILKSYLVPKMKRSQNLSKYRLMELFLKIKDENGINNFIEEFFKQNLHEKLNLNQENLFFIYENILKLLINELSEEEKKIISINNNNKNKNQKVEIIFDKIFNGIKKNPNSSEKEKFNTLFINPIDYSGNEEQMNLENIINSLHFKATENIINFPRIMILVTFIEYENFLIIPSQLKIQDNSVLKYNLLCGVSSEKDKLVSYFRKENKFIKIYYENTLKFEKLENESEINNCFIYFFEKEEKIENGYYSNNGKSNANPKNCQKNNNSGDDLNKNSNNNNYSNNINLNIANNNENNIQNKFNNNNNLYNMNNNNLGYVNNNNFALKINSNTSNYMNNNNNVNFNNMNNNNNVNLNNMNNNNLNHINNNNFYSNNMNKNNLNCINNNLNCMNNLRLNNKKFDSFECLSSSNGNQVNNAINIHNSLNNNGFNNMINNNNNNYNLSNFSPFSEQ